MLLTKGWKRSIFTTAALLALTQTGIAQPPAGPRGEGPPRESLSKKEEPKEDPNIDAWADTLVSRIADRSDTIRDSARAGLVALGHAALPALKKAAEGSDLPTAEAARKVIGRIEHKGGPGAFGPGRPNHIGPGTPGGPRAFGPRAFGPGRPEGMGRRGQGGPQPSNHGGFGPGSRGGFGGPQGFGPQGSGPGGPGNFGPAGPGNFGPAGPGNFGPAGPGNFGPAGPGNFGPAGPRGFGPGGQGGPGRPEGLSVRVMETLKDAGLEESQKEKVKAILETHGKAIRAIMEKNREKTLSPLTSLGRQLVEESIMEKNREKTLSPGKRPNMEAVRSEIKDQNEKTLKTLKEILKPEQFEKAKGLLDQKETGQRGPGGPQGFGARRGFGGPGDQRGPGEKPRD